jgi:hypothetical protein
MIGRTAPNERVTGCNGFSRDKPGFPHEKLITPWGNRIRADSHDEIVHRVSLAEIPGLWFDARSRGSHTRLCLGGKHWECSQSSMCPPRSSSVLRVHVNVHQTKPCTPRQRKAN